MQFSLRSLLVAFVVLSGFCYGAALAWDEFRKAREMAIWSDYMDGQITREQARKKAGGVVDTWAPPDRANNSPSAHE